MTAATAALLPITAASVIVSASLLGVTHDLAHREAAPPADTDVAPPWGTIDYYALRAARAYEWPDAWPEGRHGDGDLAAGMVDLYLLTRRDDALRFRLPEGAQDLLSTTDAGEILSGLDELRSAAMGDDALHLALPPTLRHPLKAKLYSFDTPDPLCFPGEGCVGIIGGMGGFDRETYHRDKAHVPCDLDGPETGGSELDEDCFYIRERCNMAREDLLWRFPWIEGDNHWWLRFFCDHWHSKIVYDTISSYLSSDVLDPCKDAIDAGWTVREDGVFHRRGLSPAEMQRELSEAGWVFMGYNSSRGDWSLRFPDTCFSGGYYLFPEFPFSYVEEYSQ